MTAKPKDVALFLCGTPYQLLVAHLTIEAVRATDPGREAWLVRYGSAAQGYASKIVRRDYWARDYEYPGLRATRLTPLAVGQVERWVESTIKDRERVEIFAWGNDTDWRYQVFASCFAARAKWLFEDGLGSYVLFGWNNSPRRRVARTLLYRPLFRDRYRNAMGLGCSDAERRFALRQNAFPCRPDANPVEKLSVPGSPYLRWIKDQKLISVPEATYSVVLTLPSVETGRLTFEEDMAACRIMGEYAAGVGLPILLKGHPKESREIAAQRLQNVTAAAPGLQIVEMHESLPFEILCLSVPSIGTVIGTMSTALATARLLLEDVPVISLLQTLPQRLRAKYDPYRVVLTQLGVNVVSLDDLERRSILAS